MISPFILSVEVPLTGAGDVEANIPADSLKNPAKTAMFVDEIRFLVSGSPDIDETLFTMFAIASIVDATLSFLGEPIIPAACPIMPICAPRDRLAEAMGTAPAFHRLTWHLKRPFYIPAGKSIAGRMKKWGTAGNTFAAAGVQTADMTDMVVRIDLVCRGLPADYPVPETIDLPYASGYRGVLWDATAARKAVDQTDDDQLANQAKVPLVVDYLGARALLAGSDVGGDIASSSGVTGTSGVTLPMGVGLRLTDSYSNGIIRDSTPLAVAVPWTKLAWRMNATLPPRSFLLAYLDVDVPALLSGSHFGAQIQLAIVGSRKIAAVY